MKVQHMRVSQFVITWGPGAILEGPEGPRIIPLPDTGLFDPEKLEPEKFEISDLRISRQLLGGKRVFRLPSNAELGKPGEPIYRTKPFPEWKLCHRVESHGSEKPVLERRGKKFSVLFRGQACPLCGEKASPVRFVAACPEGHLDDVDWPGLVHRNRKCSHRKWFAWFSGPTLGETEIVCPECGLGIDLGRAYYGKHPCSGRYPEQEPLTDSPRRKGCSASAKIVHRNASNLRIPEIRALFTVSCYTDLHRILQQRSIADSWVGIRAATQEEWGRALRKAIRELEEKGRVEPGTSERLEEYTDEEIEAAAREIDCLHETGEKPYGSLILEEFQVFRRASEEGIPPVQDRRNLSRTLIHVDPGRVVRAFEVPGLGRFRIVPVLRLRSVIVQTGYRREVDTEQPSAPVDVGFERNGEKWYPGVELFGEGIFLMHEDGDGHPYCFPGKDGGEAWESWMGAWEKRVDIDETYPDMVFRDPGQREELHPAFVWWHTLAHLFIRATGAESGYSMASIRERVYLEVSQGNPVQARGGILLYTVQPGGDGTFGGLVSLAEPSRLRAIFRRVLRDLRFCSGDPLCLEHCFEPGRYCGSACYGCLFLPETSCEHRNMWLDRNILLEGLS